MALIQHIRGTRKSTYALVFFFMLAPFAYTIINLVNKSFNLETFLFVFAMGLGIGLLVSFIYVVGDYLQTSSIKKVWGRLNLTKIGDGNFTMTDSYSAWSRTLELRGSYKQKEVLISHRLEKGFWRQIAYVDICFPEIETWDNYTNLRINTQLSVFEINKQIEELFNQVAARSH